MIKFNPKILIVALSFVLVTSCGGAFESGFLSVAGLGGGSGANMSEDGFDDILEADDEVDVDEELVDGIELDGDEGEEFKNNIDGVGAVVGGQADSEDAGLLDNQNDAELMGTGNMGPETLPVTLSKGDGTVPPSEECGTETQGGFYVVVDGFAGFEDDSSADIAWLKWMFTPAQAALASVKTNVQDLVSDTDKFEELQSEEATVYQCQMYFEEDSDAPVYEWVELNAEEVFEFFAKISEVEKEKSPEMHWQQKAPPRFERVKKERVVAGEGVQPPMKLHQNKFTGKKDVLIMKKVEHND